MANQDVKLNFINMSGDVNNTEVVIFQTNVAPGFPEIALAWQVIQNCGAGDNHPFTYSNALGVNISDSWGNYSPMMAAYPGDSFSVKLNPSGDQLQKTGTSNYTTEVDVNNALPQGSINVNIYRSGNLLATQNNVVPGEMAAFIFQPTIYIGTASGIQQGAIIDTATVKSINTQFSLLGIASADIVMTGGGSGPSSQPYTFSLQNVVMA